MQSTEAEAGNNSAIPARTIATWLQNRAADFLDSPLIRVYRTEDVKGSARRLQAKGKSPRLSRLTCQDACRGLLRSGRAGRLRRSFGIIIGLDRDQSRADEYLHSRVNPDHLPGSIDSKTGIFAYGCCPSRWALIRARTAGVMVSDDVRLPVLESRPGMGRGEATGTKGKSNRSPLSALGVSTACRRRCPG
jgi:hypothetical protein